MSKEQDLASLGKTAALLPAQEAGAITQLAALAPEVAERLHQKLISELGSQALAKDQPEKAAEMKGYGNNRDSIGEQLAAVIKKENRADLSSDDRNKLAATVAAASGMDQGVAFLKLQAAAMAPAGADYKEFQEKIDTKMGAAITSAAAAKPQEIHFRYEDFRRNGDSGKPYVPSALDEQVKKELKATLDIKYMGKGLSDKEKAAVLTIAEAAPEHGKAILGAAKGLMSNVFSAQDAGKQKALIDAIATAAIDSATRSGGNDAKVVDALAELAPRAGVDSNKDNLGKWLKGAAAAKVASDKRDAEIASLSADDPRRLELERQRDEARKAQEKNSNSIGDLLNQPGGMLMMFVGIILSALTGQDMLTPMMGGGKDDGQGAGAPAPAPDGKKNIHISYAQAGDTAPSRAEGDNIILSAEDKAKLDAYIQKQRQAGDATPLDTLAAAVKKDVGDKAVTGADLLKGIQSIDADGVYKGPQAVGQGAGAPPPSVPSAAPDVPAPAPSVPAPAAAAAGAGVAAAAGASGGTRDPHESEHAPVARRVPVTEIEVVGIDGSSSKVQTAHVQQMLLATGGKLPRHGMDKDAGNETWTAIQDFRKANGFNYTDRVLHSDELSKLAELTNRATGVAQTPATTTGAPAVVAAPAPVAAEPVVPTSRYTKKGGLELSEQDRVKLEAIKGRRSAFDFRDPTAIVAEMVPTNEPIEVKLAKLDSAGFVKGKDNTAKYRAAAERMVKDGLSIEAGEGVGVRWLNNALGDRVSSVDNVRTFQKARGIEATGEVNQETIVAYAQELRARGGTLPIELAQVSGITPLETPKSTRLAQVQTK